MKPQSIKTEVLDAFADIERLIDALRELERAVSSLHAHDLHPPVAPQFRDLHEQILRARELLT